MDVRRVVTTNVSKAFERAVLAFLAGPMIARERRVISAGRRQSNARPFVAAVIG
jgi:hypothetical protein